MCKSMIHCAHSGQKSVEHFVEATPQHGKQWKARLTSYLCEIGLGILNAVVSSDIDAAKLSRSSNNKTMDDQMPADLVVLYQDAFKHFDSDNSGIISTKMLGPLLRYCGENPSEAEIQDMVNEVDSDATGELHFPNFLQLMRKKYSDNNAEDEIREAFRVFDSVSG